MSVRAKRIRDIALIIVGNVLYAANVVFFIVPGRLITTGVTGLALFLDRIAAIPVSVSVLALNILLFAVGWVALGKRFAAMAALSSIIYPLALEVISFAARDAVITTDPLLCLIFGGIISGISIGMTVRAGASTGGVDIAAIILSKKLRIPLSVSLWAFDIAVLAVQAPSADTEHVLYGVLLIVLYALAVDRVMIIGTSKTEIKVVSEKYDEITKAILTHADRGVTLLSGVTGHLHRETQIVLSVFSSRELAKVERLVHDIDPAAFMIISRISEVRGNGF